MSDTPIAAAAPARATSRPLDAKEIATLRAALRLWIETPWAAIPDVCYTDDGAGRRGVLEDAEIERLLTAIAHAREIVLGPPVDPELVDARRI